MDYRWGNSEDGRGGRARKLTRAPYAPMCCDRKLAIRAGLVSARPGETRSGLGIEALAKEHTTSVGREIEDCRER